MGKNRIVLFLIPFLALFNASGQGIERFEVTIPALNEHKFLVNRLTHGAFIKTSINTRLGMGSSQRKNVPTFQIGDTLITPQPDELLYAELAFLYNQKIQDWVAFYIDFGFGARIGPGPASLLVQGLNTFSGFNMGWKIRLWETEKHLLSTSIGLTNSSATFVNILDYVSDIINGAPNPELNEKSNVLRGNIAAHYAFGISSLFGLQGTARYSYGDSFEKGKSESEYYIAGSFDCNLFPKTTVPMGFSMGLGYTTLPEFTYASFNATYLTNLKISYTGSPNMLISIDYTGFETNVGLGREGSPLNSKSLVSSYLLNMIYYFN